MDEASQTQRGHCEDNGDVLVAGALKTPPTLECKVGCSRIFGGHISRARLESEKDSGFDALVAHQWREHVRGLLPDAAQRKRWKSGCWWNWYNELILTADDILVEGSILESEFILEKKVVSLDDDDYVSAESGRLPSTH